MDNDAGPEFTQDEAVQGTAGLTDSIHPIVSALLERYNRPFPTPEAYYRSQQGGDLTLDQAAAIPEEMSSWARRTLSPGAADFLNQAARYWSMMPYGGARIPVAARAVPAAPRSTPTPPSPTVTALDENPGWDSSRTWYHGSKRDYDPGREGTTWLHSDPRGADFFNGSRQWYGGESADMGRTYPFHMRPGRSFLFDAGGYRPPQVTQMLERLAQEGKYDSAIVRNLPEKGRVPGDMAVTFGPGRLRSPYAPDEE